MGQLFLNKRVFLFLIAAMVALLFTAGCGSNGDSQGSSPDGGGGSGEISVKTGSLSKADFVKQASAICEATSEKSRNGFVAYSQENKVPTSGPGLAAKASDFVNSVFAPIFQEQIDQITSLGAPSGDEEQVSALVNAMQQGLDDGKQQPLALINGGPFLDEAAKLATAYGLPACSTT
jgi:hypothetical protein